MRFLALAITMFLVTGCGFLNNLTMVETVITEANHDTIKVKSGSAALVEYTRSDDGVTVKVDNRGRPGIAEQAATAALSAAKDTDIIIGSGERKDEE